MNSTQVLSNVIGGVAVLLLAAIAGGLRSVRRDFRRFMAEHLWLLATAVWNRDMITRIMARLNMPMDQPPPANLPGRKG